jgi:5-formyltetrahydrofolate cyclo-ligase
MRQAMKKEEVMMKSKIIIDRLIETTWYKQSSCIMTYIDFKNEVVTGNFIRYALNDNKRIIVPITDMSSKKLILSELKDFDNELYISSYGMLEPKKDYVREVSGEILELILVPALVYDERGYRIGYGGGYYDKLLSRQEITAITVGIAFEFQVVDRLPEDDYDKEVDYIITDERIIKP